jgi:transcriptional regulator with XRE-family HTH domain
MIATEFDAWMTEHGWSNRRLADELEVAVSSIARWRLGTRPIARTVALALKTLERRQGQSGRAA